MRHLTSSPAGVVCCFYACIGGFHFTYLASHFSGFPTSSMYIWDFHLEQTSALPDRGFPFLRSICDKLQGLERSTRTQIENGLDLAQDQKACGSSSTILTKS